MLYKAEIYVKKYIFQTLSLLKTNIFWLPNEKKMFS